MKKLKTLGIIMGALLVLFVAAFAVMAALGIFTVETGEGGGISFNPIVMKKNWEIPLSEKTAVIKTEKGEIKIALADCEAAEKFSELAKSGMYLESAFDTVAEDLFISASANGENFEAEMTSYACVYGAVGFVLEGEKAAPDFFIVTKNGLSGLSESFMTEQGFDEEKIAFYKENGGIPEYEGKVIIFGKVLSGMETAEKIAKTENSGYTGGYKPAEAVKIISAGIIEPEETTE